MSKFISCEFIIDTGSVERLYQDTTCISIDCTAVENDITNNRCEHSELDYLIYNEPLAYAELILNGRGAVGGVAYG